MMKFISGKLPIGLMILLTSSMCFAQEGTLLNISARGFVGTGENILIGGTITGNNSPRFVLFRARGQSINASVPNRLSDPVLTVFNQQGQIADSNDDCPSNTNIYQTLLNCGLAPAHSLDSCVLVDTNNSLFTGQVRGFNNTTGTAIIEIFDAECCFNPNAPRC